MIDATAIEVSPPAVERPPRPEGYRPPSDILRMRAGEMRREAAEVERMADLIDEMGLEPHSAQDMVIKKLVLATRPQGPMTTGRHLP